MATNNLISRQQILTHVNELYNRLSKIDSGIEKTMTKKINLNIKNNKCNYPLKTFNVINPGKENDFIDSIVNIMTNIPLISNSDKNELEKIIRDKINVNLVNDTITDINNSTSLLIDTDNCIAAKYLGDNSFSALLGYLDSKDNVTNEIIEEFAAKMNYKIVDKLPNEADEDYGYQIWIIFIVLLIFIALIIGFCLTSNVPSKK